MYTVAQFGAMIGDTRRLSAFSRALSLAIRPDSVVLDLGAGTGIMALLACRMGAKRVYALEASDAVQVVRESALKNDFADRIVCIHKRSTDAELPERVDLIVEDMRGAMPWHATHISDVIDARERFLKPKGLLIPGRDLAYCAVARADKYYKDRFLPWRSRPEDLDLSPASRYVENAPAGVRFKSNQLLSEKHPWMVVDYGSVSSPNVRQDFALRIERSGEAHGLLLWFDTELFPGIDLSNAPGRHKTVYGQLFLPWPRPVRFAEGSRICVKLRADLLGEDYVWTWESRTARHRFHQSSFAATPLTAASLTRRAARHRPALNHEGKMVQFALQRMSGDKSLTDIGSELFAAFPERFRSERDAFDFAAKLSGDFSA